MGLLASRLLDECERTLSTQKRAEPARVYVEYLRVFCDVMIRQYPSAWHASTLSLGVWDDVVGIGARGLRRFGPGPFGTVLAAADQMHAHIGRALGGRF